MVSVKEKNASTVKRSIKAVRSGDLKTAIPKSAILKSAIPKSAVPKSAVQKSAVPKSSVPKTAVPKSAVPKSVVTKSADRKPRTRDAVATEAATSKKKNVKASIKKQKKGTISSTEKTAAGCGEDDDATCYLSSDGFLWCNKEPDLKIIEPRILVTANFNYLEFSRKADRPPERRIIHLVNHGDQPIAFKVNTTDNYSYIIDRWVGVIPPRQTCVNAAIRMPNVAVIQVFHRPHNEYQAEDQAKFYNSPHKDKMFVLLAPQLCQTFAPEAIFHNERCYEKLRIMLRYTGIEETPGDTRPKQLLLHGVPGWMSWKEDNVIQKQKNARQMAEFRKIEMNINLNASKEQLEEISKTAMRTRQPSPAPTARARTPLSYGKRPGFGMLRKQKKSFSPFERTPKMKTAEPSETPKKTQSGKDGHTSAVTILSKKSTKNKAPVEKSLKPSVAPPTDVKKMEKNEKNVAAPKEGDTPSAKQIKKTPEKSVIPLPKEEVPQPQKKPDMRSPLATLTVPVRKASDQTSTLPPLTVDSATSSVIPSPSIVPTSSVAPTSSITPTSSLAPMSGIQGRSSAEKTSSKRRPVEKEEDHHDKSP